MGGGPDRRRRGAARVGVLLAAGASAGSRPPWTHSPPVRRPPLVKRCLDLADLLASAATGSAQVAVVSDELPGLDADSVDRLARHGVRTVAVATAVRQPGAGLRTACRHGRGWSRIGAAAVMDEDSVPVLGQHVRDTAHQQSPDPAAPYGDGRSGAAATAPDPAPRRGRQAGDAGGGGLVAVWGPHGAPGRTTVAIGARSGGRGAVGVGVTLVDADPYGGAVGQHLACSTRSPGCWPRPGSPTPASSTPRGSRGWRGQVAPGSGCSPVCPGPTAGPRCGPRPLGEVLRPPGRWTGSWWWTPGSACPTPRHDPFAAAPERDAITMTVLEQADDLVVVGSRRPGGPDPAGPRLPRPARGPSRRAPTWWW